MSVGARGGVVSGGRSRRHVVEDSGLDAEVVASRSHSRWFENVVMIRASMSVNAIEGGIDASRSSVQEIIWDWKLRIQLLGGVDAGLGRR